MKKQLYGLGLSDENIMEVLDWTSVAGEIVMEGNQKRSIDNRLTLEDLKVLLLERLKELKQFCYDKNLRFYLFEGTLLGAARHQGFIPWDDDIDVMMPIKDIKKMIELESEYPNKDCEIMGVLKDGLFHHIITKIFYNKTYTKRFVFPMLIECGTFLDVFPMIGLPDDAAEREHFMEELNLKLEEYKEEEAIVDSDGGRMSVLVRELFEKMDQYDFDEPSEFFCVYSVEKGFLVAARNVLGEGMELPFEDDYFPVPVKYDEFLTDRYGNWRVPPKKIPMNKHYTEIYRI